MIINKKILLLAVLILCLLLSLCACAGKPSSAAAKPQGNLAEDETQVPATALEPTDPIYEELAPEIPSIEAFLEYLRVNTDRIDLLNVSTDDYWNIVSVVLCAGTPGKENVNRYGEISVKYSVAEEYAKTFMYDFWFKYGAPDYRKSYAVSANPGSGVLDFTPLTVDNYEGRVEYITALSSGRWILRYSLLNHVPEGEDVAYDVLFERWEDGAEHVFPFRVVQASFVGSVAAEKTES